MKTGIIQITRPFILVLAFVFPAIAGDNICPPPPDNPELIYDPANPTDMDPGTTEYIGVIGGKEPLTWSTSNPDYTFEYQTTFDGDNSITSDPTSCGEVTVTISDSRINPFDGTPNPQTVSGKLNKPFLFDWGPEGDLAVEAGNTIEVSISGGLAPYTWTINGNDFFFRTDTGDVTAVTTDSSTIVVYAGLTSCTADIVIEDSCAEIVSGSVRNIDNGGWVLIEHSAQGDEACIPGPPDYTNYYPWGYYSAPWFILYKTRGKYHVYESITSNAYRTPCESSGQGLNFCLPKNCGEIYSEMSNCYPNSTNNCIMPQSMMPGSSGYDGPHHMILQERKKYEWQCN